MPWPIVNVIVALAVAYVLLRVGATVLGSFARPVPAPPDPGALRKVRLTYRPHLTAAPQVVTVRSCCGRCGAHEPRPPA